LREWEPEEQKKRIKSLGPQVPDALFAIVQSSEINVVRLRALQLLEYYPSDSAFEKLTSLLGFDLEVPFVRAILALFDRVYFEDKTTQILEIAHKYQGHPNQSIRTLSAKMIRKGKLKKFFGVSK
jgi:hypothetical protein